MTFVSSPVPASPPMDMSSRVSSPISISFFSSAGSHSSLKEVEDEPPASEAQPLKKQGAGEEKDQKIYVAVEKEFKLAKSNLVWVLKNTPKTKKIVIVHVHVPAQMIPMSKPISIYPKKATSFYKMNDKLRYFGPKFRKTNSFFLTNLVSVIYESLKEGNAGSIFSFFKHSYAVGNGSAGGGNSGDL